MPAKKATSRAKKKKRAPPRFTVHIVSDATGTLARHVVNSVLTQFPQLNVKQVYHTFVYNKKDIALVAETFRKTRNLVVYGLVKPSHKTAIRAACEKLQLPNFDLTGSLVQFIAEHTQSTPINEPSLLHETNAGYFQRIAAMEFTAQHDDSRRLDSLDQSDIVIVGLSRVSKSPTATFLGSMGYKVANVSITLETGFPPELAKARNRIVAFTTSPKLLQETRARRFKQFKKKIDEHGLEDLTYYDMRSIIEEVVYAESEYRKRGYPIVDISKRTVEELSAIVLRALDIKKRNIVYQEGIEGP